MPDSPGAVSVQTAFAVADIRGAWRAGASVTINIYSAADHRGPTTAAAWLDEHWLCEGEEVECRVRDELV